MAELRVLDSQADQVGMRHVRLGQSYKGLEVLNSQILVHFGRTGAVATVNGRYAATPSIRTTPALSSETAGQRAAKEFAGAKARDVRLVLYLINGTVRLAYDVAMPSSVMPARHAVVDAETGSILLSDDGLRYDGPLLGSGIGLAGESKAAEMYLVTNRLGYSGPKKILVNTTKFMYSSPVDSLKGVIETYDAHSDTVGNGLNAASLIVDPNGDGVLDDNLDLRAGVDAHYFAAKVYDYYLSRFGRNSWDNHGGSLINVVHYLLNLNNAFWNGQFMAYGDGDGVVFKDLAKSFDVIAHEITHGVTQSTANLEYKGESGALNESWSDVMAAMIDSTNWKIGEDAIPSGHALRDLSNPHNGDVAGGFHWQPDHMSEFVYRPVVGQFDHGNVHINSGIPNHAAYLVASTIGRPKTAQIWYRALVFYLVPQSHFVDARNSLIQAAGDLYGAGGTEAVAVGNSFDAVGIPRNLPRLNELAYDDGNPETYFYDSLAGSAFAVRMNATQPGDLKQIDVDYLGDTAPAGTGSFTIQLLNPDINNHPGQVIWTGVPFVPGHDATGWLPIDMSSAGITVDGYFYIARLFDGVNIPAIAVDNTSNLLSWVFTPGTGWALLDGASGPFREVEGKISSNSQDSFGYQDQRLEAGKEYFYRVVYWAGDGPQRTFGPIGAVAPERSVEIFQVKPNPMRGRATIAYDLPHAGEAKLEILSIEGRRVMTLSSGRQAAGRQEAYWTGRDARGLAMAPGIYFARLTFNGVSRTRKLVVM